MNISAPHTYVYGVVAGINTPYDIGNYANVCDNLESGESCPMVADQKYGYSAAVDVSKAYPPVSIYKKTYQGTRESLQWPWKNQETLKYFLNGNFSVNILKKF